MLGRTIRAKHGMPYKARASWVRSGHSSQTWGRPRTRQRAAGWMEASREACEMHEGQNAETSSRHQAQIHLESVHAWFGEGRMKKGRLIGTSSAAYSTENKSDTPYVSFTPPADC